MKVEQLANKNQFIIRGGDGTYFQSYESICAKIDTNGNLILYRDWDYSKTTLKHLYLFIDECWYYFNRETKEKLSGLLQSKNRREMLQNLIDAKKIDYCKEVE